MNVANWIAFIGVTSGSIAFVVGLIQYQRAQKWKRAEFAAQEFKEFKSNLAVANAMLMLDWSHRIFRIDKATYFDHEADTHESEKHADTIVVNDTILANALVHHTQKHRCISPERRVKGFTGEEIFVRDVFDEFFYGLTMFESFIASGLVSAKEFQPYLEYWIDIIAGSRNRTTKPDWCIQNIWHYIDSYGYESVKRLIRRYGYEITPKEKKTTQDQ